ncbi:MAG TPA: phenylalanine--tRNA ligase subunit beta [Gemmatimonadaceae bacterium]|nr:phenylalanine--tRNA ligase subunit beta [Gemmatimonadaceae bacterium]
MNASYEWLRAFVDIDASPSELRELFTAHTATVDEIVALRTDLAPIVVARVLEAHRHPDSDHLWVTQVDAGGAQPLEVICGAPNVTTGALYPFAPVGTTMPNGMKIERRKIRGINSNGMLCSAREIGLGEDHAGILELQVNARPGAPFLTVMPVGDSRLVLDVGANRPDLLSHLGLARELSAITGKPWHLPALPGLGGETPKPVRVEADDRAPTRDVEGKVLDDVRVVVEADTRCRRYIAAVVGGVKIGASPEWMVRRLEAVGVRSINNVVDATNYVLHELGQPVHAFDASTLHGGVMSVRRARAGETLMTLDGVVRKLPPEAVVIADRQAQAVAGVMGGRESEVSERTVDLFIEVASFDPKLTRSARRAIGLNTDASYRFERGVDPELGPMAMDRVLRIIVALAGGTPTTPLDLVTSRVDRRMVTLRSTRVTQVLGAGVPMPTARGYLERAGFEITSATSSEMSVRVPTWRTDVTTEIDLVEEVARFHGYDTFPTEIRPFRPTTTRDDPMWTSAARVRDAMVGLGFYEARPMPFVAGADETHARVANPLAENEAHLRGSLLETLARRAEYNLAQRVGDIRLFEIGSAFVPRSSGTLAEELRLGVVLMGRRRPAHFTEPDPPSFDEWDAKGIATRAAEVAHPGTAVRLAPATDGGAMLWNIESNGASIGTVSRLMLDAPIWASPAFAVELRLGDIETAQPAARGTHTYKEAANPRASVARYRGVPTMPAAEFDLALLVPAGVTADEVERVVRGAAGDLLERLDLFDQYTGEGVEANHRSLAWRLTFRHPDRTLRDKEIEGRRAKILGALEEELHVRQRTA